MNEDWLDLLPIESLESLLEVLAVRWRNVLDAERVTFWCLSTDRRAVAIGSSGDDEGTRHRRELAVVFGAREEEMHPLLAELGCGPLDGETFERSFDVDGVPFAAVDVVRAAVPLDAIEPFLTATRQLIAQGRAVDRLVADALAEKLESMAEFAAGAGHEINNPLATINGRVQLLLKGETDPERRRSLEVIGGQAHRVRDMIGDAMLFGRPPEPQPADVDGAAVIRRVCETFREDAPEGVNWSVEVPDELPLRADESQFAIVVGELLRNSLHAVGENGAIVVRADGRIGNPSHGVITVTDDGPGLTELDRRHLFDPFYSGRQAGRGLGFGLSKAWRIVRLHGGTIDVESQPGETTFSIRWPLTR